MTYEVGKTNKKSMKTSSSNKAGFYKEQTVEEVLEFPIAAIEERGITKRAARHFGIRTEYSSKDGETPVAYYFPYYKDGKLTGFKKRDLTKAKDQDGYFTVIGYQGIKCDLFGTDCGNVSGGKKVYICEGEFDAAICWQTLKKQYPKLNPTVLSISNGTSTAVRNIAQKQNTKYLKKFKETVLVFDNDKATPQEKKEKILKGQEATAAVYGLLPDMLVVKLPEDKDPCDVFLEKGQGEEQLYWMLMKPVQYTPEGFTAYEEIRDQVIAPPKLGKPWPWPAFTKLTLGRRPGEGYYFGSGVKMGKSELANKLIEHINKTEFNIKGEPQKVAVFKFEEPTHETVKKVAGKFYKKDFTNPERMIFIDKDGREVDVYGKVVPLQRDGWYTQEDLIVAADSVGPQLILYNNYGRCHWDELKGAIRHAVLVEHVEDIIIDPVTRLTAGMSPSEANTELERFADEISKMAIDLQFNYYCFCHLKAPERGQPHEFGGKIFSNQFTGSRAMMRACFYMVGMEGNKSHEVELKKRNTRTLIILDDRKYGRTGAVKLFYDWPTGDFVEPPEGFWEDDDVETLGQYYEKYPDGYVKPGTTEEEQF